MLWVLLGAAGSWGFFREEEAVIHDPASAGVQMVQTARARSLYVVVLPGAVLVALSRHAAQISAADGCDGVDVSCRRHHVDGEVVVVSTGNADLFGVGQLRLLHQVLRRETGVATVVHVVRLGSDLCRLGVVLCLVVGALVEERREDERGGDADEQDDEQEPDEGEALLVVADVAGHACAPIG